jgi:hypothetical protein
MDITKKVLNRRTGEIVQVIAVSEDKQHVVLGKTYGNTVMQTGYALMSDLEEIKDAEVILPKAKKTAKVKAQAPVSQSAEETVSKAV